MKPIPIIPIILYGHLHKRFGRVFHLAVKTPSEAIRALCVVVPGFEAYLLAHSAPGYRVLVGEYPCTLETISERCGSLASIKIVPVVAGAKDGELTFILGAVLVGAGVMAGMYPAFAWASKPLIGMGMSMMLGGVAQLLSSPPIVPGTGNQGPADTPVYSFGSPRMTTGQGHPVPLCYGKMRVGGALISVGLNRHAWQPNGFGGISVDEIGTVSGNGDSVPWNWSVGT